MGSFARDAVDQICCNAVKRVPFRPGVGLFCALDRMTVSRVHAVVQESTEAICDTLWSEAKRMHHKRRKVGG